MMRFRARRLTPLLSPALLALVCASCSGVLPYSRQDLGDRLERRLTPDIEAGRASVQPLPRGAARVIVTNQTLFPGGGTELDDDGRNVLARAIEGLLDPRLLRIQLADASTAPVDVQAARTQAVTKYFTENGLGATLQPAAARPGMAPAGVAVAPQALTITVMLVSR